MMQVKIITPLGLYKTCEATQINAASVEGEFGLLSNHMPLVCMLQISKMEIVNGQDKKTYAIAGGMLYFKDNEVRILTDAIEGEEDIDVERAKKAKERAERRLNSQRTDIDMRRAEIALKKAINRINIKSLH